MQTTGSTSPVPAGSRVTFFASPKKVTKEKTDWLSPDFCCEEVVRPSTMDSMLSNEGSPLAALWNWTGSHACFFCAKCDRLASALLGFKTQQTIGTKLARDMKQWP